MKTLIRYAAYPLVVLLSLGVYAAFRGIGLSGGLSVFLASVVNMAAIGLFELAIPLRKDWSLFTDGQSINDILHAIFASEIAGRVPRMILASLSVTLTAYLAEKNIHGIWPSQWHITVQALLVLVISEIVFYFLHRFFHTRFAWRLHALHHNPDRMHVLKSGRLHAVEIMIRYFVMNLPFVLLGAPAELILLSGIWGNTIGNLGHANLDVRLPRFLNYILVTPGIHLLHHAADQDLGNSNFSGSLSFMDHIFGTYRDPQKQNLQTLRIGIEHNFIPKFWLWQLLAPVLPNSIFRRTLQKEAKLAEEVV